MPTFFPLSFSLISISKPDFSTSVKTEKKSREAPSRVRLWWLLGIVQPPFPPPLVATWGQDWLWKLGLSQEVKRAVCISEMEQLLGAARILKLLPGWPRASCRALPTHKPGLVAKQTFSVGAHLFKRGFHRYEERKDKEKWGGKPRNNGNPILHEESLFSSPLWRTFQKWRRTKSGDGKMTFFGRGELSARRWHKAFSSPSAMLFLPASCHCQSAIISKIKEYVHICELVPSRRKYKMHFPKFHVS